MKLGRFSVSSFYHESVAVWNRLWSSGLIKTLSLDIVAKGANFAFIPLFTTILSKQEYGLFTYLYLIITTVSVIFKIGMDTAFQKLYFDYVEERRRLIFNTIAPWLTFFILAMLSAYLTGWDLYLLDFLIEEKVPVSTLRLQVWLFIFLELVSTTLTAYYITIERFRKFQYFNFFKILLSNVVAFAVLSYTVDEKVATKLAIESSIGLLILLPLIVELVRNCELKIDKPILFRAFKIGFPLFGSGIATTIYLFSDRYFLQESFGLRSLAIFNFCVLYSLPVALIFTSFNTYWLPRLFQRKNAGHNLSLTNNVALKLMLLFVVVIAFFWVILVLLMHYNFIAKGYESALYFFPLIGLAKIFETLTHLYTNFLIIFEKTSFQFLLIVTLSCLTFFLNYMFTPVYGLWAAVVILIFLSVFRLFILYILATFFTRRSVAKTVI